MWLRSGQDRALAWSGSPWPGQGICLVRPRWRAGRAGRCAANPLGSRDRSVRRRRGRHRAGRPANPPRLRRRLGRPVPRRAGPGPATAREHRGVPGQLVDGLAQVVDRAAPFVEHSGQAPVAGQAAGQGPAGGCWPGPARRSAGRAGPGSACRRTRCAHQPGVAASAKRTTP
jgi:hypothetical protein